MRSAARRLADGIELCIAIQEELVELAATQRSSLVAGLHDAVEAASRTGEIAVLRLSAAEAERQAAAEELADALGVNATRWSTLRAALGPEAEAELAPRVARLEAVVRELELANAVNSQIVVRELHQVDIQIRGLSATEVPSVTRGYTKRGDPTAGRDAAAILLNTSA